MNAVVFNILCLMFLLLKEFFNPEYGLFVASPNKITVQPHPLSKLIPEYLTIFRYIGRIVAKIFIDDLNVEVNFTRSFLKHILKKDLYIHDFDDIDPETARNLIWCL